MGHRVDDFEGPEPQYIEYLEGLVHTLRGYQRSLTAPSLLPSPPCEARQLYSTAGGSLKRPQRALGIVHWKPDSKRQRCAAPSAKWRQHAEKLLSSTPEAGQWLNRLREVGLYDVLRSGEAAKIFLEGDGAKLEVQTSAHGLETNPGSPIERLRDYTTRITKLGQSAEVVLRLVNVHKFLILSACKVLLVMGVPKQQIFDVVRLCMGCKNSTDRYCEELLRAAVYMNRLIDDLSANGWDGRAAELLLIWDRSPAYYYSMSKAPEDSVSFLRDELKVRQITVEAEERWVPFFVPSIVRHILDQKPHVARVGHILGYKHAYLLQGSAGRINPWLFFNQY